MDKFYLYDFEEPKLSKIIQTYKQAKQPMQLVAVFDRKTVLNEAFVKNVNKFVKYLATKNIEPHDIIISLDGDNKKYSVSEWQKIKNVAQALKLRSIQFGIDDYKKIWDVKEVENANNQIDKSAKKIAGKNFSPMEKLLSAYLDVTKINYKFEDKTEHFSQSRSIYGVLNSDKIVCVGFAALLKAVIEKDGEKNIKMFENSVAISEDNINRMAYHRNLIVYIKDEKYEVDGYYYLDPTWDSTKSGNMEYRLNHFLVPLKDIQYISTYVRDLQANLKQIEKPKDTTYKTKKQIKAIVKNRFNVYNYMSKGNASFSSDKFVMNKPLLSHIAHNKPVRDRIDEYIEFGKNLYDELPQDPTNIMENINKLLKENNIEYVSNNFKTKMQDFIEKDAKKEEILEYAENYVKNLRFGKINLSISEFKQLYLESLKVDLEKAMFIDVDKQVLDSLKTPDKSSDQEQYESMIKVYEDKILSHSAQVNSILNEISDIFDKDPKFIFRVYDKNLLEAQKTGLNFLAEELAFLLDVDQQSILSKFKELDNITFAISTSSVFRNLNVDIAMKEMIKGNDYYLSERQVKNIFTYEAMCDSSKPISYNQLSRALFNVLANRKPRLTSAKIKEGVDMIMQINAKRSAKMYKEGATNAFYKMHENLKTMQSEQGISK